MGMGQENDWFKIKRNVNTIKNFLTELQRPIVVKADLNCLIKLQLIYTFD